MLFRSKAAADVLALQAFLGDGLGTLRVRAFNHTGPGQSTSMLVPGLAQRIAYAERDEGNKVSVGRIDVVRDLSDVRDVVRAYREGNIPTRVLSASLRHPQHVKESALAGAHIGTMPFKVMQMMFSHPLTDKGLAQFTADYKRSQETHATQKR